MRREALEMGMNPGAGQIRTAAEMTLQVYLLGEVDFEAGLRLQRRLHYEVSGDRAAAVLVLCEHPPLITVGRQGSRAHILCEPEELRARQWRVRWVNRGGGTWLHLPGQLAVYPILPLDRLGLGVDEYVQRLHRVTLALLSDLGLGGTTSPERLGVWIGSRLLAPIGVAVRDWVSYFGLALNINPPLVPYRLVRSGLGEEAMTSLERERRGRLRPAYVRQLLIERFAEHFGFGHTAFFSSHPALQGAAQRCTQRNGQHNLA